MDDPVVALRGSKETIERNIVRIVCTWLILGLPLAFRKGQLDRSIEWIGVSISHNWRQVVVEIPKEKVDELLTIVNGFLCANMLAAKRLRQFAGECVNISTVILVWRPFLSEF